MPWPAPTCCCALSWRPIAVCTDAAMPDAASFGHVPLGANGAQPVVEVRGLSLEYGSGANATVALADITMDVEPAAFVSLIGPSGCGKTTLLRTIADLEEPTGGRMRVNGLPAAEARRNRSYGYVFQAPALLPWRTVARNVMLPLEIMGLPAVERRARAAEYLQLVGLSEFSG